MRRLFALLSALCLVIFAFGCSGAQAVAVPPDSPHQAQADISYSVALIHDFGVLDTDHGAFCSGTWVAKDTILTAAHCVKGYARMRHQLLVMQALKAAGFDPQDVVITDLDSLTQLLAIFASVPLEPALGLDVPYIVPSQVREVGLAPSSFQHSTAIFVDSRADLALLRVTGYMPEHGVAPLADHAPAVGEDVTLTGNIHNNFFSFRQEQVSAYRNTEKYDGMNEIDGPFMQLSGAMVSHGDSGSGVFNTHGQLVGVMSFVSEVQLSYCIHLETIRSVMIGQHLLKAHIDVKAQDPDLTDAPLNLR